MKNLVKRIFLKRRLEADLNTECAVAATEYIKKTGVIMLPLKERTDALNYVAHGFSMGWRACEASLGVTEKKK